VNIWSLSGKSSPPDGGVIEAWKAAPREPVFLSEDPQEWRFIEAMWYQEAVAFRYWGGSSPGAWRRIVPRRVFRVGNARPLYFSGWCPVRGEERTFRIDRAQLAPAGNDSGHHDSQPQ
jgi:predicted DNA-binding transcriptional regulator YafY